jgi:hypothetical protein
VQVAPGTARTIIVVIILVLVAIVAIGGAIAALLGSEPVHDWLQNVAIVTAGLGFGAGGLRIGNGHSGA